MFCDTSRDLDPPLPFEELRRQGHSAAERGQLEDAVLCFDGAIAWADANRRGDLAERAFCGKAAATIELGRGEEVASRLHEILMRNRDAESTFLAAYNLARIYDLRKQHSRALVYARKALDRARELTHGGWLVASHNQVGNLLLAQSHFEEARSEFEEALVHLSGEPTVRHGMIFDNLGYCSILAGSFSEAFRLLFASLRIFRRLSAQHYYVFPHISLAFAYLEIGRHRRALAHSLRALALAERHFDSTVLKNCLYLVGEAYQLLGRTGKARSTFERLQRQFYPDADFLTDFLLSVNIRGLINLKG
jgi:tetratricopeptide (TPR) repeat protein